MHLAVLMTNTDESAFAQAHPKDGEKFTSLIQSVRPNWRVASFSVKDSVFPKNVLDFDGVMITGSPASVLDAQEWVDRLLEEIRRAYAAGLPMFGACFGHQAIALALGGAVERNSAGWGFGLIEMQVVQTPLWLDGGGTLLQYGAHVDHVTRIPEGAQLLFAADHCPNAGFAMGRKVYTTQNHPEMTPDFVAALVEEYAEDLGEPVATHARQSLVREAETERFALSIARFFEQAVDDNAI